ncbi:primosomal protein N' [Thermodesulfobacteriota bacterium]
MNRNTLPDIVNVAVAAPVDGLYSYLVPEKLNSDIRIGKRVLVPFKNREVFGYVIDTGTNDGDIKYELKSIIDIPDPEPLFTENLIPFFKWISDYYLYPLGLVIQSALPGGLNVQPYKTGLITDKGINALKTNSLGPEQIKILKWVNENPLRKLFPPLYKYYRLEKMGLINIKEKSPGKGTGPLKRVYVKFVEGENPGSAEGKQNNFKAENELDFLNYIYDSDGVPLSEILSRYTNGGYLVNKWVNAGVLQKYSAQVFRDPTGKVLNPSPEPSFLFDQQKTVLKQIRLRLEKDKFSTCLLHGVTGSGKTEVYYRAVSDAISLGKQAILLLPEIALTLFIEGIFRSRLGNRVAVFHSGLSRGERYDQWIRMLNGDIDLVIGARSAVFAPLSKLGLIIVDEEYDSSYKQEESPRYQARDAAVARGKIEDAVVILGSGTPSVQSFYNAKNKRYHLLSMPERVEKRPLPEITIADMKSLSEIDKIDSDTLLSPVLTSSLKENFEKGKQAILFLNRRGFSRIYLCRSCGESVKCPNCDLTLTYHKHENKLVCHYCEFRIHPEDRCSGCGHVGMKAYGFGTERLERELVETIPGIRIARFDRDSTRKKGDIYRILKSFSNNELDMLVGTQMVTKGYDFPDVTLVGVISADLSLGFPDFRAGERTFQILSQVAGRAGRGTEKGKVIIQTFNPGHYAIEAARKHDYTGFFERERELRELLEYPPFSYLACLRFSGNSRENTERYAREIGAELRKILNGWPKRGKEIHVLGPAEAPLAKLRGKYRWQLLLKSKRSELLHYFLRRVKDISRPILNRSGVSMVIDIDPYQML